MAKNLLPLKSLVATEFLSSQQVDLPVIFDVGANVGQSLRVFKKYYPASAVYCFEPTKEPYEKLTKIAARFDNTLSYNVALSNRIGEAVMKVSPSSSVGNRILSGSQAAEFDSETQVVATVTGDHFSQQEKIDKISFLKIDTEGHDLNVLLGFLNLLSQDRIKYVQVESSMSTRNRKHIQFAQFCEFFDVLKYGLVGVFEQVFARRAGALRRANILFASPEGIRELKKQL